MNHIYRLVWNETTRTWAAVAETAKGRGKRSGAPTGSARAGRTLRTIAAKTIAVSLAFIGVQAWALDPTSLPTGGQVVAGSAAISQAANALNVQQASQRAILNWQSFNIGAAASVNFSQPNASAVALNRILGNEASQIYGKLNANGQVFFINPNGMLFARGAQVNVGGLMATTLNIGNADFMSGNYRFSNPGNGTIRNEGLINAVGSVVLVGNSVQNAGQIFATTATLAAGNTVALDLTGDGLIRARVEDAAIRSTVENSGEIGAASVTLSAGQSRDAINSVVNNTGLVRATGFGTVNGEIVLEGGLVKNAGTLASVNADGSGGSVRLFGHDVELAAGSNISASGSAAGGNILVMGDLASGSVKVAGRLDASAPVDGNGGIIETSAAHVDIANDTRVTTAAAMGLTGTWLIDPVDFTIAASGGNMTGAVLSSSLVGGNVTILSTNGTSGTAGDVNVNDVVGWSANKLTLNAQNNININATLNGVGTASLALEYGQASASGGTSDYKLAPGVQVNLPAGPNFSTQRGSNVANIKNYTVITDLGAEGSVTPTDLQGINGVLTDNYVLGSNIDASATSGWSGGEGFMPIGNASAKFTGTFDGLGHTVVNLTINRTVEQYVGLFGYADTGSAVRNVGLLGGSVTSTQGNVGALVGLNNGSVGNSYSSASVSGAGFAVGGLVGTNGGTIARSHATGLVTGYGTVGGLVGSNSGGTISDSHATGGVTGTGDQVGGLVGMNYSGSISNSHATGSVGGVNRVGGLVGQNYGGVDGATISNSYATGNVSGTNQIGGLVGLNTGGSDAGHGGGATVTNSAAMGSVTGNNYVGGLVGFNDLASFGATVSYSYATGGVNGNNEVGGLVGHNHGGTVNNSYATGSVGGSAYASNLGGLVGFNTTGSIADSYATGNVSGYNYIGGLVGYGSYGSISNSYATGSVSGNDSVGGLVGYNNAGSISNSYATGNVNGAYNVGGLVGYNYSGDSGGGYSISGSHATGSISGTVDYVGGLVGYNYAGDSGGATISNSYATGSVISFGDYTGGLVGYNESGSNAAAIIGSHATGSVVGGSYVGGLVGYSRGSSGYGATISNSYATGQVNGFAGYVGGLVGSNYTDSAIANSSAAGQVNGASYVGGLVGYNRGTIGGSQATGNVISVGNNVGGLVGFTYAGTIGTSSATGGVSGNSYVGGLVGRDDSTPISDSYAAGSVSGAINVGGLSGFSAFTTITNSYAMGSVSGVDSVGGLVGYNNHSTISDTFATGKTSGTGSFAGGLVGSNYGTVDRSFAAGSVSGSNYAGGLVGKNYPTVSSVISNSYATGNVSGSNYVGGLVGSVSSNSSVRDSYATGDVSGSDRIGGLAGLNLGSISRTYAMGGVTGYGSITGAIVGANYGSVSNSYSIHPASPGLVDIGYGAGSGTNAGALNIVTMRQASNFSTFDFATPVWRISEAKTRPYLAWQGTWSNAVSDAATLNLVQVALQENYTLSANIDMAGKPFSPIGNFRFKFSGAFDGQGHTISNLVINAPDRSNVGMFGVAKNSAVISNLGLVGGKVSGLSYVGALVGRNEGTIANSYATSSVSASDPSSNVGGLVGMNWGGSILNSYHVIGAVSGRSNVGGLVGWNAFNDVPGTIENSYAGGSINIGNTGISVGSIGGLVGFNQFGEIRKSFSTTSVNVSGGFNSTSNAVGGLVGTNSGLVEESFAAGSVSVLAASDSNINNVGGLVGMNNGGTISNSYASGSVIAGASTNSSTFTIGGLVGYNYGGSISNTYATGRVQTTGGGSTSGPRGLVGINSGQIHDSYWNSEINPAMAGADGDVSGPNVTNLAGLTTAGLRAELSGFDFASGTPVWQVVAGTTRPYLAWQGTWSATISDAATLNLVQVALQENYTMSANVDMFGKAFTPIGTSDLAFTGSFNGQNHTISNLVINTPKDSNVGMFGVVAPGSTISNVGLVGGSVSGHSNVGALAGLNKGTVDNSYAAASVSGDVFGASVGGLVGYNYSGGMVSNSHATGSVSGGDHGNYAGGLVGKNSGTVDASYATGSVSSGSYSFAAGGLVGQNLGTVTSSHATGDVGGYQSIGGLVGQNYGTINLSHATGNVNGSNNYIGGLVGAHDSGTISDSYATGSVSGNNYVGGLVGRSGATIGNSYATGSVSGNDSVGGLVGRNDDATVSNSYATGSVDGNSLVGGLVGFNSGGTVSFSYATGSVSGNNYVGGLVGTNGADGGEGAVGSIANSYATGQVSSTGDNVGGLVGRNIASVSESYATGSVSGGSYIGGLVGANYGTVSNSYSKASVQGDFDVGGLIGYNDGTVSNSYATGAVRGNDYVGGLVGYSSGTISNSYATGSVRGGSYAGGLVGVNYGSVNDSYWNVETSVQGSSDGGVGLGSLAMLQQASFGAWDIAGTGGSSAVWRIYEGRTTPLLRSFLTPLTVTADDVTKTYDGSIVAGLANAIYSVPGADISGHIANITDPYNGAVNAGSYAAGLYSDQAGFDITHVNGALTINPAGLTTLVTGSLTGISSKPYDSNTTATLAPGNYSLVGFLNTDNATVTQAVGTYGTANVGTGITVSVTLSLGDYAATGSTNLANYTLPTAVSGPIGEITPASLTLSGARIYDGTTAVAGSVLIATGVAGQTFSVTGAGDASNLASKNVQAGGALASVTGLALGSSVNGGLSSNYNALATAGSSIDVTKAGLLLAGSQVYNGGTAFAGANLVASGVAGETFAVTGAGDASNLASKNVQAGSTLATVTGLAVGTSANGGLSGNYEALTTVGSLVDVTKAGLLLTGTQVYNGGTAYASANLVANGVAGETFAITGAGDASNLASKNVQTGSALATLTGLALGTSANGGLTGNYDVLSTTGSAVNVTQLASVAWTGGSTGNWSSASNWAGGALPDANNVAVVSIPIGTTVIYDNAVGATQLTSLASLGNLSVTGGSLTLGTSVGDSSQFQGATLDLSGGQLTVNGSLQADVLRIGGGTLNGSGNLTSPDFAQSGGVFSPTLSNLILASVGNFNLTNPLGATQSISLSSSGAILDALSPGPLASVSAPSVQLTAASGIGTAAAPLRLSTTALQATTATGAIQLYNAPVGGVTLAGLVTGDASDITYDQDGQALHVIGPVTSQGGNVLVDPPADILLGGAISTTGGGSVTLEATNNLIMAPTGTVNTGGGAVVLNAGGSIGLASINAGSGIVLVQTSGGQIGTTTPGLNNVTASDITLNAQTGIVMGYIASAVHVSNVSGLISLTDFTTGITVTNQAASPVATETQTAALNQIATTIIQQTSTPGKTESNEITRTGDPDTAKDKEEDKPVDRPTTETVVVGGNTIQKPADEVVNIGAVKGQTLVCRVTK